jgi:hypothetical protein
MNLLQSFFIAVNITLQHALVHTQRACFMPMLCTTFQYLPQHTPYFLYRMHYLTLAHAMCATNHCIQTTVVTSSYSAKREERRQREVAAAVAELHAQMHQQEARMLQLQAENAALRGIVAATCVHAQAREQQQQQQQVSVAAVKKACSDKATATL